MIVNFTGVVPLRVVVESNVNIRNKGGTAVGRMSAEFTSEAHSLLAFETLQGPTRPDKSGRPQKRVYLKGGGYICVRGSSSGTNFGAVKASEEE